MKTNRTKQVAIVGALLVVVIVLAYGIYEKTQPNPQVDVMENSEATPEVSVEDIENKITVDVPKIQETESVESKQGEVVKQQVPVEVEKPVVPPKPKLPENNEAKEESVSEPVESETNPIPKEEDVIKSGDEEENAKPPTYEEQPKVEEEPVENSVVVTPNVPEDTSNDRGGNLVPDSENPFMQPSEKQENNNAPGGHKGSEFGDGEWGTGDKF